MTTAIDRTVSASSFAVITYASRRVLEILETFQRAAGLPLDEHDVIETLVNVTNPVHGYSVVYSEEPYRRIDVEFKNAGVAEKFATIFDHFQDDFEPFHVAVHYDGRRTVTLAIISGPGVQA